MNRPLIRTAFAVMLSSVFSAAAEAADEAAVLVTATRIPTRASEVLSDVTVIGREDIERAGSATLPELLSTLPGVQTTTNGGPGASGSLFIRGTNSTHALVLVDGQRISSATFGTTAIEHIPLEQIERIEILRGPASSLYGADAVGGVIQIFTRRGEGKPAPSLLVGAGRYGKQSAAAAYGGEAGDTRFHVQLGQERAAGFSDIKEARGGATDMFNADRDGYDNRNLSARLSQRIDRNLEIGADYFYSSGLKHYDTANCSATFPWPCTPNFDNRLREMLESSAVFADLRVSPVWKTSLRIGRSKDQMQNWLFDPLSNVVDEPRYNTRQDQLTWQNDIALGGGKLLAAAEWRGVHVDSTQALVAHDQTTRAFVLGYQKWFGKHSVQASARTDTITGLGRHDTGSLAYGYQFADRWVARASLGTAFHAPTFNDLYWPFDAANWYQGNPNLQPERARNRDVGISYETSGASAGATLYYNSVTDLIDFVPGVFPVTPDTMANVSSATLKGATFQYVRRTGVWDWKAAYDILNARDNATGRFLQRRAPRTGSLEVRRGFDRFDVGARAAATSSRFNDKANTQTQGGFTVVGVDANYRLSREWGVQARIDNLFAKNYVLVSSTWAPYNDYAVPGRSLFVGLRWAPR